MKINDLQKVNVIKNELKIIKIENLHKLTLPRKHQAEKIIQEESNQKKKKNDNKQLFSLFF